MKTFRQQYLSGHHLFAIGHNHRSIRDIYKSLYSNIDITIKSLLEYDEKKWNINTCDVVYECSKCKIGGTVTEEMINLAEEKDGTIESENFYCSNKQCNNYWEVTVVLIRKGKI